LDRGQASHGHVTEMPHPRDASVRLAEFEVWDRAE